MNQVITIAIVVALSSISFARDTECNQLTAQREGYRIEKVEMNIVGGYLKPPNLLPTGSIFSIEGLNEVVRSIPSALRQARDAEEKLVFISIASATCSHMNVDKKTVTVEIRIVAIDIPQGEKFSDIIDERSQKHAEREFRYPQTAFGFSRDHSVGDAVEFELRTSDEPTLGSARAGWNGIRSEFPTIHIGGWKSIEKDFYSLGLGTNITGWQNSLGNVQANNHLKASFSRLPFAGGDLLSSQVGIGVDTEQRSTHANFNANVDLAYSRFQLNLPANSFLGKTGFNLQAAVREEVLAANGFLRFGAWLDHGFENDQQQYTRSGGFVRWFQYFGQTQSPLFVDLIGTGGASTDIPVYRMFTGGNRLDPFLASAEYPSSEFTWAGPILRGFGISSFTLAPSPISPGQEFVEGMHYAGYSLTIGLPGFARPYVTSLNQDEATVLNAGIRTAIVVMGDEEMTNLLRNGIPVDKARKQTRQVGEDVERTVRADIRYSRKISIRPLVAFDGGTLASANRISAICLGGGVHAFTTRWGLEALFMDTLASTTQVPDVTKKQLLIRFYYRVHIPVPFRRKTTTRDLDTTSSFRFD